MDAPDELFDKLIQDDLRYFEHTVRELSITRAALRLQISQPALTKALFRLEIQIGHKLLSRSHNGVKLTRYGEQLYTAISQWRLASGVILANVRLNAVFEVKLGCHSSIALDFVVPRFKDLRKGFPQLKLVLANSIEITHQVYESKIDCGLVVRPKQFQDLVVRQIAGLKRGIYQGQLNADNSTVFYNPHMLEVEFLRRKLKALGESQLQLIPIEDYEVIGRLVRQNDGLGILPEHVALRHELKPHRINLKVAHLPLCLIYRGENRSQLKPLIDVFTRLPDIL